MISPADSGRRWLDSTDELVRALRKTSWGWMSAVATPRGLTRLTLPRDEPTTSLREISWLYGPIPTDEARFADLFDLVERYFAGERAPFDFPLDLQGTEFQRDVWMALRRIPYGQGWSYQDVARAVGRPLAARPVGQAVGRNPLGIVVPCHRVIAADGAIGGFGGGLELKRRLLTLEGVNVRSSSRR
jgi:methylated-DNA-[protein]-cysteine S-methyltransferase